MYDKNLHINHTVPNQRGMSYFTLILDNEGFIRNIEQRRDKWVLMFWLLNIFVNYRMW